MAFSMSLELVVGLGVVGLLGLEVDGFEGGMMMMQISLVSVLSCNYGYGFFVVDNERGELRSEYRLLS